ncbi:HIRAN domain-containing protein [Undibacterium sp. Ji83W]|uniref:HIRAN domain-containing protein n=1 Tax=Undibacterium sp. Ji83W TaxID=3413043 RepID=UPI003BF26E55
MKSTLFVAWQQPDSLEWIPIASLIYENNKYLFSYTQGVFRAKGFAPFGRMDKLDVVYESDTLFPLFSNRLINKSRPEFRDYLRWLGLNDAPEDNMSMLALTGGVRGTDLIELFQPPILTSDGFYKLEFFARSLVYLPKSTINLISELKIDSRLFLMKDSQNEFDPMALALRSESPKALLGYCPKYYAQDLDALLHAENSDLKVHVKCINLDAPLNMRLRCSVTAKIPSEFTHFESGIDFRPVIDSTPER